MYNIINYYELLNFLCIIFVYLFLQPHHNERITEMCTERHGIHWFSAVKPYLWLASGLDVFMVEGKTDELATARRAPIVGQN